jgi:Transposase
MDEKSEAGQPVLERRLRILSQENPMNSPHYIGFDVHKKHINFCIKDDRGGVLEEGRLPAERSALRGWAGSQTERWHGAMGATLFSGWIFDTLQPYAAQLEMAHKAIACAKKKNDRMGALTIADLLRCNLLPACHLASPEIRELAACCDTASWWCANRCACKTKWRAC